MIDAGHRYRWATLAVIAVWALVAARLSYANPTIGLTDVFGFIPRAESLSLSDASAWVDGLYPLGYPLLLRAVAAVVTDYELAGRIIALLAGILGLFMVARIARTLFEARVALLAVLFCATNPSYLRFATTSGTDLAAVAVLLVAMAYAVSYALTRSRDQLVVAGFALGVAYLFRYTALIMVPPILFWIMAVEGRPVSGRRVADGAILLGAFVLAALPQLVMSTVVEGQPLYNLQARNVYFGMHGGGNWGQNMPAARSITSLGRIVAGEPTVFVRHWYETVTGAFRLDLVHYPLGLLAFAAALLSLRTTVVRKASLLIVLCMVAFLATLSMAFINARLLLFLAPLLAIYAAFGCFRLIPSRLPLAFAESLPFRTVVVVSLCLWLAWYHVRPMWLQPISAHDLGRIAVSQTLASEPSAPGPHEVLAWSFDYYDMTRPTKDRYAIDWYADEFPPYGTVADIAGRMRARGQRYLVYDEGASKRVRGLAEIWPLDGEELLAHFEPVTTSAEDVWILRLRE
ncbi:MAG: glycosyltransferase family 39 protein [Candidatus Krumholzibacteriia bacterium]